MSGRRLRVVTLIDRAVALGGGERVAMHVALRLDRDCFDSFICATRSGPVAATDDERVARAALEDGGVPLLALGRSGTPDLAAWAPFLRMLRRERIDVLHAHMFGSNLWGTLIGRLMRVPVIVAHEHGWAAEETTPLRRRLDRHVIARGSHAFVAVSDETRRRMIEIGGMRPDDVVFIPNGIPPASGGAVGDVRAELGIEPSAPVIGTVAVLRPEKDLSTLIRSAALLRSGFPGLRVLIAGGGPERTRLEALVDELDLGETVIWLGFRSDVSAVLTALDVAAFSSTSEGSPLAVMEAMEAARPIVATRVGGISDLVDDGVHGFLVPPGDHAALADAIARVLREPAVAAQMGVRARERRRREFDVDVMVARVEKLYEHAFARSARGRREGFTPRVAPCDLATEWRATG